jgi:hypothetical protein
MNRSTLTYRLGVMDEWEASVTLSKISFSSNYFYDFGIVSSTIGSAHHCVVDMRLTNIFLQGIPKLSMLAFYWGVFPSDRPAVRKALYVITAYVCLGYTAILFDDTFYCGTPVSVQWSQEDGACSVFYAEPPFYFNTAINLSSYIFSKSHPHRTHFCQTKLLINHSLRSPALPPQRNGKGT